MTTNKYIKVTAILTQGAAKSPVIFTYVKSGAKHFFNAQHLLIQLNPHARAFYDYLCEQMNAKTNNISITAQVKNDFITHIKAITSAKTVIKPTTVTQHVATLNKLGLIIQMSTPKSAFYCVNPKYVYRGSELDRCKLLKNLIETRSKGRKAINMLIKTK